MKVKNIAAHEDLDPGSFQHSEFWGARHKMSEHNWMKVVRLLAKEHIDQLLDIDYVRKAINDALQVPVSDVLFKRWVRWMRIEKQHWQCSKRDGVALREVRGNAWHLTHDEQDKIVAETLQRLDQAGIRNGRLSNEKAT